MRNIIVVEISVHDSRNTRKVANIVSDLLEQEPSTDQGHTICLKDSKPKAERRFHDMREHGVTIQDFRR
jgi:hypothetical protein